MVQATMKCSWLMSNGWLLQGEVTMQEADPAFNEMRMALDLKDNQSCTPLHLALMHGGACTAEVFSALATSREEGTAKHLQACQGLPRAGYCVCQCLTAARHQAVMGHIYLWLQGTCSACKSCWRQAVM